MIYIYALDILKLEPTLESYRGIVPESRLYQLSVLPQREQKLGLAAELLFQRAVHRHCREMPLPVSRDKGSNGKPYLLGRPDFHFNLSHSGVWAVCAVADAPVGVDIQQLRPVTVKIERRFSNLEQQRLLSLSGEEQTELLFDLWVQKEAYIKCTGEGLQCSLKSFEAENPGPGFSTQLVEFPAAGYHLAVCVQEEAPSEVQMIIMPM